VTLRLVNLALSHWNELDGYAVSRNMPELGELPLGRFFSFVWWWATRNGSEADVAKFTAQVWRPPPNTAPAKGSPWDPERENAAFAALKAGLGK
jgi:hypothetical protein